MKLTRAVWTLDDALVVTAHVSHAGLLLESVEMMVLMLKIGIVVSINVMMMMMMMMTMIKLPISCKGSRASSP